jgi:hypothetical protein
MRAGFWRCGALRGRLNLDWLRVYALGMREGGRGENTSDLNPDEY